MCATVDANGKGDGEGTHVSVFVYLMKGDNDDSLTWPFTGTVTFELLNQMVDKNHHKKTVTLQAGNAGSKCVMDSDMLGGSGHTKFIPIRDLMSSYYDKIISKMTHSSFEFQ